MAKRSYAQLKARQRVWPNPPKEKLQLDDPLLGSLGIHVTSHADGKSRIWVPNVGRPGYHLALSLP